MCPPTYFLRTTIRLFPCSTPAVSVFFLSPRVGLTKFVNRRQMSPPLDPDPRVRAEKYRRRSVRHTSHVIFLGQRNKRRRGQVHKTIIVVVPLINEAQPRTLARAGTAARGT